MFSLTICFGPAGTMWQLMFREKEKAESALAICSACAGDGSTFDISDDFGQRAAFTSADIRGWMFEDLQLSKAAHIERALHQARTQAEGQQLAENDSVLRAARARQGPAIIDPMGTPRGFNGGFPR